MGIDLPVIAGSVSTIIFALSTLPMLVKAARTKDLASYSVGNILLSNLGNAIHSVYVFSLPAGPVWVLHSFYVISTGLMLVWYLRYARPVRRSALITAVSAILKGIGASTPVNSSGSPFLPEAYAELPTRWPSQSWGFLPTRIPTRAG
jgi:uncharacterized protein with PQ loop repeat